MEEVLLVGIKDRQVCQLTKLPFPIPLELIRFRAICHFGTTRFLTF